MVSDAQRRRRGGRKLHDGDAAAGAVSDVHDRASIVLWQDDRARWLDLDADVDDLLSAEPADRFTFCPFAAWTG